MKPLKVLFLCSCPSDLVYLNLGKEVRAIDAALRMSEFRDFIAVQQHWDIQVYDLQELLMRYRPHIVHFSGHGSKHDGLMLQNIKGSSHPISGKSLRGLFSILKDNVRCVVLNACFSEVQAREIGEYIDCIIGMSGEVSDEASIAFSTAFYRALGYGRDVKTAFELGCSQIELQQLFEDDMPQLLTNTNPSELIFIRSPASRHEVELKLDSDFSTFTKQDQANLLHAIQALLDMNADIRITKVREGSVFVTVELPKNMIIRLYTLARSGSLSQFSVINASLASIDLSEVNISGVNLAQANLSGTDLTRANLARTNLTRANLSNAELVEANLRGTNLTGANLTHANLYLAQYDKNTIWPNRFNYRNSRALGPEAYLRKAIFYKANLTNVDLSGADLEESILIDADLSNTNLSHANLVNADLTGANLANADLREANLSLVKFDNRTKWPDDMDLIRLRFFAPN